MKPEDLNTVNRYLDGELKASERGEFETRLLSDPQLREYVKEMNALVGVAGSLEVLKAPAAVFPRGMRLRRPAGVFGPASFLAGAVTAAACILLVTGLGSRIGKAPSSASPGQSLRVIYYAPGAGSVSVLGDFNGWSREIPLKPRGDGGYWSADIQVRAGEYRYVLLVDGEERTGDPQADYVVDDDFGSKNSVVRIGL